MIDCLFVGILKDYGQERLDFSHEFLNLYTGLVEHPRLRTRAFFVDLESWRHGADGMRARLADLLRRDPPHLLVHQPFTEELDVDLQALADLSRRGVPVLSWDADSSWRFDSFIRARLFAYTLSVTTHAGTVARYREAGARVHLSQWAVSSFYGGHPPGAARPRAISFAGRPHGDRKETIRALRRGGLRVDCFGPGWGRRRGRLSRLLGRGRNHGYVSFLQLRRALGESRISLNLAGASIPASGAQIKGRHFEIPALGACQVSTPADEIEAYYEPGKEIVLAASGGELLAVLRERLGDPAGTQRIAQAGHRRTWAEHTWERRIDALLEVVGL